MIKITDKIEKKLKENGVSGQILYHLEVDQSTFEPILTMSYVEGDQPPRKLVVRWNLELAQELSMSHVNLEDELVQAMVNEIMYELRSENPSCR